MLVALLYFTNSIEKPALPRTPSFFLIGLHNDYPSHYTPTKQLMKQVAASLAAAAAFVCVYVCVCVGVGGCGSFGVLLQVFQ